MITVLIIYWIATSIYGAYWAAKNPPFKLHPDSEYFTLLEVVAKLLPAMCIAWIVIPMMLLNQIKFKRK